MATNRSEDIVKVMKDIANLRTALGCVNTLKKHNSDITSNLENLGQYYTYSVKIPQEDFFHKMYNMNSDIDPAANSMQTKIETALNELEELLQKLIAEQKEYESENGNTGTAGSGGGGTSYMAVM